MSQPVPVWGGPPGYVREAETGMVSWNETHKGERVDGLVEGLGQGLAFSYKPAWAESAKDEESARRAKRASLSRV